MPNSQLVVIDEKMFYKCKGLEEVDLSDSRLIEIKKSTFFGCQNLRSVILPNSVEAIDSFAFCFCHQLQRLKFGENSRLLIIRKSAFSYCSLSLFSFRALTKLETIGDKAFEHTDIIEFSAGSGMKTIGSLAFSGCQSLSTIQLHGDTTIGKDAFAGTSIGCGQDIKGSEEWKRRLLSECGISPEALEKCSSIQVDRHAEWYDEFSSSEEETPYNQEYEETPSSSGVESSSDSPSSSSSSSSGVESSSSSGVESSSESSSSSLGGDSSTSSFNQTENNNVNSGNCNWLCRIYCCNRGHSFLNC